MSNILCGPARDRPLCSTEDGVDIFKILMIRVKLMFRHCSWLEVETTLSFGGFAIAKVETT